MKHTHFPTAGLMLGMAALLGACTARMAENTPPAPVGAASTTAAAAQVARVNGTLAYASRIALPPQAYAVVEVRNSAAADARPVVADKRIPLNGAQPPIPFVLEIDRMRVPQDIGVALRAAFYVDGVPEFVSDAVPLDLTRASLDLGEIRLRPMRAEAFGSELECGGRWVRVSAAADAMQLNVDGALHRMTPVVAASGSKYQAADNPAILFWSRDGGSRLYLDGSTALPCRHLRGGPALADLLVPGFRARGQEPAWQLTSTADALTLSTGMDATAARYTPARWRLDGRRAVSAEAGAPRVTVLAAPCVDSMSGMVYPAQVTVESAGMVLRGCGGEPGDLLAAQEWIVEDLDGGGQIDRSQITLRFTPDGRLSGKASCNRYTGRWQVEGERLVIRHPAASQMACAEALMQQEGRFFRLLGAVSGLRISPQGVLVLTTPEGRTLTARPVE